MEMAQRWVVIGSVLLSATCVPFAAHAQAQVIPAAKAETTRAEFAESLERERDYYRAIGVWKELRFASARPEERARYSLHIAEDYARSGKYMSCVSAAASARGELKLTLEESLQAELITGECYAGMKVPFQAEQHLRLVQSKSACLPKIAARAELALALTSADGGKFEEATQHAANATLLGHPNGKATEMTLLGAKTMTTRSPALALVLSAVLPGAGQAYSGHWFDAAQALFFVGAFGVASYAAFRYEQSGDRPYVLTPLTLGVTGVFYLANILGAERTARFYNQRQKESLAGAVRETVLGP
jgi:hypothetical protein